VEARTQPFARHFLVVEAAEAGPRFRRRRRFVSAGRARGEMRAEALFVIGRDVSM
jgi:hypothetical protein